MALIKTRARGLKLDDNFAFTGTITGAGGGKIGQVIQATTTTTTNVASTSFADTGLSASITPTSSSSKVLVIINQNTRTNIDTNSGNPKLELRRGSTSVITWSNHIAAIEAGGSSSVKFGHLTSFDYLDSPSSTSSTTYSTRGAVNSTSNNGQAQFQSDSVPSIITLMEILA
jgi:hypothetical protein